MMRKLMPHMFILMLVLAAPAPSALALDLPPEPFQLLAESALDPCSICAEQKRNKAFNLLNRTCIPGAMLTTDTTCRLVKVGIGDDNELAWTCYPSAALLGSLPEGAQPPRLVFRFHTPPTHLVGVSEQDFTDASPAAIYRSSLPGAIFEGQLKLISYKYGDGRVFNYFQQTNTLQIHCMVVRLKAEAP